MNIESRVKYRPSFTARQIDVLTELCKANHNVDTHGILKTLIPMQAKIAGDFIAPSYVNSAKVSMGSMSSISNDDDNDDSGKAFDAIIANNTIGNDHYAAIVAGMLTDDTNFDNWSLGMMYGLNNRLLTQEQVNYLLSIDMIMSYQAEKNGYAISTTIQDC